MMPEMLRARMSFCYHRNPCTWVELKMTCVVCGYEPSRVELNEDPYRCPQCEPQAWRPSLARASSLFVGSVLQLGLLKLRQLSPRIARGDAADARGKR